MHTGTTHDNTKHFTHIATYSHTTFDAVSHNRWVSTKSNHNKYLVNFLFIQASLSFLLLLVNIDHWLSDYLTYSQTLLYFWLWEVVKLKICKYVYLRIFSLTTSQSQKWILKADFKWECPYFCSNFFWSVLVNIKKVKKWISHCIFKKWYCSGRGPLWI